MPSRRRRNTYSSGRHKARKSKSRTGVAPRRRRCNQAIALLHLPKRSQSARDRALHVLAEMRNDANLSLVHAARLHGVKPSTIKKYFGSALKKVRGRVRVTRSDRFAVTLFIPDAEGNSVAIRTRSSKERTEA